MNAVLKSEPLRFRSMTEADVDAVHAIERLAYPFPWTPGNFRDSLAAGYVCRALEQGGRLIGYSVLQAILDEGHVLNCCVDPACQRQGHGRALMLEMIETARSHRMNCLFLEVRPSNVPALRLYEGLGFEAVGLRRQYYPAHDGREDALVMRLILS